MTQIRVFESVTHYYDLCNHCLCFFLIQNQTSRTFLKTSFPKERNKTKLLFLYVISIDFFFLVGGWEWVGGLELLRKGRRLPPDSEGHYPGQSSLLSSLDGAPLGLYFPSTSPPHGSTKGKLGGRDVCGKEIKYRSF